MFLNWGILWVLNVKMLWLYFCKQGIPAIRDLLVELREAQAEASKL